MLAATLAERVARRGEPLPQRVVGLAVDALDRLPLVDDRAQPVAGRLPRRRALGDRPRPRRQRLLGGDRLGTSLLARRLRLAGPRVARRPARVQPRVEGGQITDHRSRRQLLLHRLRVRAGGRRITAAGFEPLLEQHRPRWRDPRSGGCRTAGRLRRRRPATSRSHARRRPCDVDGAVRRRSGPTSYEHSCGALNTIRRAVRPQLASGRDRSRSVLPASSGLGAGCRAGRRIRTGRTAQRLPRAISRIAAPGRQLVVLGSGPAWRAHSATARGTFAGFGVAVEVALGRDEPGPVELPLSLTVGAWLLRDAIGSESRCDRLLGGCRRPRGRWTALARDRAGLLVMGDGSACRSMPRPATSTKGPAEYDAAIARLADGEVEL